MAKINTGAAVSAAMRYMFADAMLVERAKSAT